ncbi:MAG TPA: hypothetical protein VD768_00130, partial [Sphingomicrobium sp.]|nr:hypothetical protein [Sphingomicrobium sp.]
MKRIGWAIALAAAFLTPAAAQEPATNTAAQGAAAQGNAMTTDPAGTGGPPQVASQTAGNPSVAQPVSETGANTLPAETTAPFTYASPTQGIGAPDGRMGVQEQVTEVGKFAANFHDRWLLL